MHDDVGDERSVGWSVGRPAEWTGELVERQTEGISCFVCVREMSLSWHWVILPNRAVSWCWCRCPYPDWKGVGGRVTRGYAGSSLRFFYSLFISERKRCRVFTPVRVGKGFVFKRTFKIQNVYVIRSVVFRSSEPSSLQIEYRPEQGCLCFS
jgi:hypothetical protein